MKKMICLQWIFVLLLSACTAGKHVSGQATGKILKVSEDSLQLIDGARKRSVPVQLYLPQGSLKGRKVIIFSHGYGENLGGANKGYTYITNELASNGFFVASIQHELASDSLLPMTGIPQIVRRTNWERGVENIRFVLGELKSRYPELDFTQVTLIGHSNGGDITMLFAQKYPEMIAKAISLDNRRVALPRTKKPMICSLRSSDQPADEGVLPSAEEQDKYEMRVIYLENTRHNDMDNDASPEQRAEINRHLLQFLKTWN